MNGEMTKDDMLLEALFLMREAAKLMDVDYAVMPMKVRELADRIAKEFPHDCVR